jgi:hypothetical protein
MLRISGGGRWMSFFNIDADASSRDGRNPNRNGAGRRSGKEQQWMRRVSWEVDEINRHNGLEHRMSLAALLSVGCVGDGWSIHQETLE